MLQMLVDHGVLWMFLNTLALILGVGFGGIIMFVVFVGTNTLLEKWFNW